MSRRKRRQVCGLSTPGKQTRGPQALDAAAAASAIADQPMDDLSFALQIACTNPGAVAIFETHNKWGSMMT